MKSPKERWLVIRIELVSGAGEDFDPPPGRDFLAHPHDSFASLARAIDSAFARWDIGHLHEFQVGDTRLGPLDDDADEDIQDEELVELGELLREGTEFTYVFDFGDNWLHRCHVRTDSLDPDGAFDGPPDTSPVPIFGWGSIPDQYGRDRPGD